MGGFISDVTDFVGLTDYDGAEDRANAAVKATNEATTESLQIARENIAFQQEQFKFQQDQYNDWKSVYGDLQENMGEYYKNLSGSTLVSKQLQAQATEYAKAQQQVTQQLAQRGISGSGVEAAAITTMGMQSASQRATIRAGADEAANAEKMKFLGLGLGQGTQMLGVTAQQASTVGNASNTASSNVLQGGIAQGNQLMSYANTNLQGSYDMTKTYAGSMTTGAANLAIGLFSDEQLKTNIKFDKEISGIRFYTWEWTDEAEALGAGHQDTYGVLAQEVRELYPDVVIDNGRFLTVDYNKLYNKLGV